MADRLSPDQSELGKKSEYSRSYDPERLFPVARQLKRNDIGVEEGKLPFYGFDIWNHYEVSWLNEKGKPIVAIAEIIYGCDTPNIIESKSMKLYFNSFNNTQFKDAETLKNIIEKDLSQRIGGKALVKIIPLNEVQDEKIYAHLKGTNLDELDIDCSVYDLDISFLKIEETEIEETLCTDLLRSNCLITGQPDWGSVQITYKGKKINHEGLLRYIVSFRNHIEFAEHCAERIFTDILRHCKPTELSVTMRSTRRGGLDINPYRSTKNEGIFAINERLCRQ